MYTGTYQGLDGGKAVFLDQGGGRHNIYLPDNLQGQLATVAIGTQMQYEAVQPPGKRYYRMTSFQPVGTPAPIGMTPTGQVMPQQPGAVQSPAPPPPVQNFGPGPAMSSDDDKAMHIFVTGIIGRALHGTGQVPDFATLSSMVYNARRAFIEGMAEPLKPAEPDGPPDWHNAPPV